MKRKPIKRLRSFLFLALCLTMFFGAPTAEAKTMEKTKGITWDLFPNKTITYYTYMGGAGYIRQKAKMTNVSTKLLSDKKTAQLKFTMNFTKKTKLSAKQIHGICKYRKKHPEVTYRQSMCYWTIVDNKTGKSLYAPNPYGVNVTAGEWKNGSSKKYKAGKDSVTLTNNSITVTVTYPISYTRMCIGVGGVTKQPVSYDQVSSDPFWGGTKAFWKSKMYFSTKKKVAHFIRYAY